MRPFSYCKSQHLVFAVWKHHTVYVSQGKQINITEAGRILQYRQKPGHVSQQSL